jgi:UDP-arabinose 4-epimerase
LRDCLPACPCPPACPPPAALPDPRRPFSAALLRYFNVIGADPRGRIGPHLKFEANKLYPRIVDAAYDVALGLRHELRVMGSHFPTKDGSAARDYIHVTDLVDAHVKLM